MLCVIVLFLFYGTLVANGNIIIQLVMYFAGGVCFIRSVSVSVSGASHSLVQEWWTHTSTGIGRSSFFALLCDNSLLSSLFPARFCLNGLYESTRDIRVTTLAHAVFESMEFGSVLELNIRLINSCRKRFHEDLCRCAAHVVSVAGIALGVMAIVAIERLDGHRELQQPTAHVLSRVQSHISMRQTQLTVFDGKERQQRIRDPFHSLLSWHI